MVELSSIRTLKDSYPWPKKRPDVPYDLQGWFRKENRELLKEAIEETNPSLIVELGSWKGLSTTFLLKESKATVLAVDHWRGSPEHPTMGFSEDLLILYETFINNCWDFRDRLIPIREDTMRGLQVIAFLGLEPGLFYIDAAHDENSVFHQILTILSVFPGSLIIGDDYTHESVKRGIDRASRQRPFKITVKHAAYRIETE